MKQRLLGRSGIAVSELCLGSMTWGEQNSEAEGHAQIDMALDHGVNFIDTAELYSTIPVRPETYGRSEEVIGSWLARTGRRDDVVIATKIAGKGTAHIRGGADITAASINAAVEGSLRRLQTDVIDLYQIHWPSRGHYHFRRQWLYDPSTQDTAAAQAQFVEILEELDRQVKLGRIRAVGTSNETAWGMAEYCRIAESAGLPRMATIQNEYSLMYRTFDLDLAEVCHHEEITLLAYSPLAAGLLTGKYSAGAVPSGARGDLQPGLNGRLTESSGKVADAYGDLARAHGLTPVQLALAYCRARPVSTIPIFGATSLDHLEQALAAADVTLGEEVLEGINALHRAHPHPF